MLCQLMSEGSASLYNVHLGHPLQGMEYTTPFCWFSGTRSSRCTSMWWRVLIGQKDHLDVRLCEDPSHCLRETMDVGQGYSCSGSSDIHFLSV